MPKISQLTSLTTPDNSDELAIVDVSASSTKKITRTDFLKGSALPNDTVTTASITDNSVTSSKINFSTFSSDADWDSGWIPVTFQNGWGNGSSPVSYRKVGGIVYVQGHPTKSPIDTTTAFTLPAGFRPSQLRIYNCIGQALNYGKVAVDPTGTVTVVTTPSSGSYVGLDTISFPV